MEKLSCPYKPGEKFILKRLMYCPFVIVLTFLFVFKLVQYLWKLVF